MTTTTTSAHRQTGERVELARYTVSAGQRVIYGQRINGVVRITDCPASPGGRAYLVERELEQDGHTALRALLEDYLEQSRIHDHVPMASGALGTYLEQLTAVEDDR
jgi:hypothetical protein